MDIDFNISVGDDIDFPDLDLDFNLDDFDILNSDDGLNTRYMKPVTTKPFQTMKHEKAEELADSISCEKNERHFVVVSGNFIFGDFLEALIDRKNIKPKKIYISTLSLNQDNVDSLVNIIEMRPELQELNIIISNYFFSHEKYNLVKYLLQELDKDNKLQLAVCRSHCKISMIETEDGKFLVAHGSANLRSSACVEQFVFEENEELYRFNETYMNKILENYSIIDKKIKEKTFNKVYSDTWKTKKGAK